MRKIIIQNISAFTLFLSFISFVACSENEDHSLQSGNTVGRNLADYDSVYDSSHELYVVNDGEYGLNTSNENEALTSEEISIGNSLSEYAVQLLMDYEELGNENAIFSPVSATMIYSLMANFTSDDEGSDNVFLKNMGVPISGNNDLNSFYRKFLFKKKLSANGKDAANTLSLASNHLMNRKSAVYKSFLSLSDYYGFAVKGMDLDNESNVATINELLNNQLGDNTMNIKSSELENTISVITSSVSFNGEWEQWFSADSTKSVFTNADGRYTGCTMLHAARRNKYSAFTTFDMMEFPYKGNYSMYVALPRDKDGLSKAFAELRSKGLIWCMNQVSDTTRTFHSEVLSPRVEGQYTVVDTIITDSIFDIRIPKIKLNSSTSLNPSKIAGSSSSTKLMYQANLPKVSPNGFKLSNVFQLCSLEVDENKTTASSKDSIAVINNNSSMDPLIQPKGTGTGGDTGSTVKGKRVYVVETIPFHANHPFVLFIREKEVGTILFTACVKTLK